jgi:predicted ribosome quality control (RQC) complex YloA/Tae2 family protein
VGRHFRFGRNKIIVGRDEKENKILLEERGRHDLAFEASGIPGPISVLQGLKSKNAIELAAKLTAFYADAETAAVRVDYGGERLDKSLIVAVPNKTEVEDLRIRSCVQPL